MNKITSLLALCLLVTSCQRQIAVQTTETELEITQPIQIEKLDYHNEDNIEIPPLGYYRIPMKYIAPNGKILRIYNDKIEETPWGPVHSPIVYLYDKDGEVLSTYNTVELLSEIEDDLWPGDIDIDYNSERNSFDMLFSLDAYGNYGTGYIDLYTNEYVRELLFIPVSEEEEKTKLRQGIPDDYIEGSNLKKIDPDCWGHL